MGCRCKFVVCLLCLVAFFVVGLDIIPLSYSVHRHSVCLDYLVVEYLHSIVSSNFFSCV